MFEVSMTEAGVVKLKGRFDAAQAPKATEVLSHIQGNCVIDCQELDYVSSAGIGVLIATYSRLHDQGHSLRMTNLNANITRVLHYAGLTAIFQVG